MQIADYTDAIVGQIGLSCRELTQDDLEKIGRIVNSNFVQFKADIIDTVRKDCISGVTARLEQTLSLVRSA